MLVRGFRDIKTHGSLSREGKLIGVARDLHKVGKAGVQNSSDWNVERHIFKKPVTHVTASLPQELYLEKKIKLHQIEVTRELLEEMRGAMALGLPVAKHELERLMAKLAALQAE